MTIILSLVKSKLWEYNNTSKSAYIQKRRKSDLKIDKNSLALSDIKSGPSNDSVLKCIMGLSQVLNEMTVLIKVYFSSDSTKKLFSSPNWIWSELRRRLVMERQKHKIVQGHIAIGGFNIFLIHRQQWIYKITVVREKIHGFIVINKYFIYIYMYICIYIYILFTRIFLPYALFLWQWINKVISRLTWLKIKIKFNKALF